MKWNLTFFLVATLLVSSISLAEDPTYACRVKKQTIKKYGNLIQNAGCILSRKTKRGTEFLLVSAYKKKHKKAYSWPGGGSAKTGSDKKAKSRVTRNIANSMNFKYAEPAICTASRETREELGLEVVVGDLVHLSKHFAAFECAFVDRAAALKHIDSFKGTPEVKSLGWYTVEDMQLPNFLRFENTDDIAREFLQL